jgi:hypothetical protein
MEDKPWSANCGGKTKYIFSYKLLIAGLKLTHKKDFYPFLIPDPKTTTKERNHASD